MASKFLRRARAVPETLLVCAGFCVLPWLPRRWAAGLAHAMGRIAFRIGGTPRKVALANLDAAYGDALSKRDKQRIAQDAFVNAARLVVDFFWFAVFTRRRCRRWVRFDESFRYYRETTPAIVITAHIGNWEVMGQAMALQGYPCVAVAAPLPNLFIDWIMTALRQRAGQQMVPQNGAVRAVLSALNNGGRTVMLPDQNTLPFDGGVFVDFFGMPVPMTKIAHILAARTGAKVVFFYCLPDADGGYTAYAQAPVDMKSQAEDEVSATQLIANMCEEAIRRHPGQWCWTYKRWRYVPPGYPLEAYPYYRHVTPPGFMKKGATEYSAD